MTKPKNETPEHRAERLRKDRERRAAKRRESHFIMKAEAIEGSEESYAKDLQAPIEKAPETAMQISYSNQKQPDQLLSDAAFHDYLERQKRRK